MRIEPDATGRQKTRIAQLCMTLKITDHIEEKPMSQGEAGREIRWLVGEVRAAKLKRSKFMEEK